MCAALHNLVMTSIHFIYSFLTAEKDVQVARKRGGGGGIQFFYASPYNWHGSVLKIFQNAQTELGQILLVQLLDCWKDIYCFFVNFFFLVTRQK